ncbi:GNAT family N-acetyltransferase [Microbispora corallina]|uniref:GNAT family N-acetyltransferase n=1 Tax=Microbispora corallina TaxID=83302 RepID=A0ABQ4FS13_9ACTN|nr:GNAT family N-acetyltransferase [Microbispora corallina]GIH37603.1 GNAT family N-acetyltransferase [Microbispora corallina]
MHPDLRMERLDPASPGDGLTALHGIVTAQDPAGPVMSPRHFAARAGSGAAGERAETWVAWDGGEVVGGHIAHYPPGENGHLVILRLAVHPGRLREGIGTSLLDHAIGRVRADGRRVIVAEAAADAPGSAFAKGRGFALAGTESRMVLDLTAADWSGLELLRARAARSARDYSLERWTGPAGPDLLDDMAWLMNGMNDEPMGDLKIEERRWNGDRIRAMEESTARTGLTTYTMVARHTATGEPAGFTQLLVDPCEGGGWAWQSSTSVLRPHRGRRLGLVIKLAAVTWFRACEPSIERVVTWNSTANPHMLAINRALGYEVLDGWNLWQLEM